ncbi:MAG TPA: hypothetical protein VG942_18955 [Hyphomonadaceae bacterium]|nr:hypothetical protein [Hyphomonadaceae bacterium]
MKPFAVAGVIAFCVAPAFAQEPTTLQYVLKNGVVIHAERNGHPMDFQVTYSDNGASSMTINGQVLPGRWRVDGDKFCTSNVANPTENCFVIPAGKKPGDSFTVMTPAMGETTLTINK